MLISLVKCALCCAELITINGPFPKLWPVHARVGTLYNGIYVEALLERGTFFRLQVYERVGISLVDVYETVGKSFHSVIRPKRATRCAFYGCEMLTKRSGFQYFIQTPLPAPHARLTWEIYHLEVICVKIYIH